MAAATKSRTQRAHQWTSCRSTQEATQPRRLLFSLRGQKPPNPPHKLRMPAVHITASTTNTTVRHTSISRGTPIARVKTSTPPQTRAETITAIAKVGAPGSAGTPIAPDAAMGTF